MEEEKKSEVLDKVKKFFTPEVISALMAIITAIGGFISILRSKEIIKALQHKVDEKK